jgi:hypothetical protein
MYHLTLDKLKQVVLTIKHYTTLSKPQLKMRLEELDQLSLQLARLQKIFLPQNRG